MGTFKIKIFFNNCIKIFQLKNVKWNISNSDPYKLCVCLRYDIAMSPSADYQAHTSTILLDLVLALHYMNVPYNRELKIIRYYGFVSLLLLLRVYSNAIPMLFVLQKSMFWCHKLRTIYS